jgi:hypothetical protein
MNDCCQAWLTQLCENKFLPKQSDRKSHKICSIIWNFNQATQTPTILYHGAVCLFLISTPLKTFAVSQIATVQVILEENYSNYHQHICTKHCNARASILTAPTSKIPVFWDFTSFSFLGRNLLPPYFAWNIEFCSRTEAASSSKTFYPDFTKVLGVNARVNNF